MADYGIFVNGENAASRQLMNTKYPFLKMDTQDTGSFRTVRFRFVTEPPMNAFTIIHRYPHDLGYAPLALSVMSFDTRPTSLYGVTSEFYSNVGEMRLSTVDGARTDTVVFFPVVNATEVLIYAFRQVAGGSTLISIASSVLSVSVYVTTEPREILST